ncbi:MAG: hypothetical protein PHW87_12810 [Methanothrix sp.]|nr:hypothetical protein [Methanothrix sp.]
MARLPKCSRRSRKHLIKPVFSADDAAALELETAKQILAEVFRARPSDVEDMIIKRLEERSEIMECSGQVERCSTREKRWIKENRRPGQWGTWPEMFQVGGEIGARSK